MRRNVEPQGFGCLEVDHQLELRRLLYGQVSRFGSFQDLPYEHARAPVQISQIGSITYEATKLRKSFLIVDGR
jgi:hypothetical protein